MSTKRLEENETSLFPLAFFEFHERIELLSSSCVHRAFDRKPKISSLKIDISMSRKMNKKRLLEKIGRSRKKVENPQTLYVFKLKYLQLNTITVS